ncbi:MAG: sigma-70 family RNA polymerase sigma factor [Bythopirellula sp.]|nr:sigma-70 family RNA polymerase sigma factor [Bythopirellula sp.]
MSKQVEEFEAENFVELMTQYQGRLYGYILTLSGDPDAANDVLQEANIVLWKQWSQFEPGSNFKAWAFRIAHFQFMAYRQKRIRDKVLYSDELLSLLASEAKEVDESHEQRAAALEKCLARMAPRSREAIRLRYSEELKVGDMAQRLHRSANTVYQILFRARKWLIECVQKDVSTEIA